MALSQQEASFWHFSQSLCSLCALTQHSWSHSLPLAFALTQQLWPARTPLAPTIRARANAMPANDLVTFILFLSKLVFPLISLRIHKHISPRHSPPGETHGKLMRG